MCEEDLVRTELKEGKGLVDLVPKKGLEKPSVAVVVPEDPVKGHLEPFKKPSYRKGRNEIPSM